LSRRCTRRGFWPLHRKPRRLVENQHVLVFIERDRLKKAPVVLILCRIATHGLLLIELQRRHTHLLPGLEALVRLGAPPVNPQFALSDDPLDMGEGELRKAGSEEPVDPHLGLVRFDDQRLHPCRQRLLRLGADLGLRGPARRLGRRRLRPERRRTRRCGAVARPLGAAIPRGLVPTRTDPLPDTGAAALGAALP
jgi:hypothetical protein